MPVCINTDGSLPSIRISRKIMELAKELEPIIEEMKEGGEITLIVQHGWVSSIGKFVRTVRQKMLWDK